MSVGFLENARWDREAVTITGVRHARHSPLTKGGSAEGAGVVLRDPKDSGITLSQKLLDNPLALRDHRRCALPPFLGGNLSVPRLKMGLSPF